MEEDHQEGVSTTSVSKGCFLFNAKPKRECSILTGTFEKLPGETELDAEKRHRAYVRCWSAMKEKIDDILSEEHDKMFSDLLRFIQSAQVQLETLHENDNANNKTGSGCSSISFLPARLEIPTVALMAGVNMPDHDVLFAQLRQRVREQISPHVVVLRSRDCNTGVKATMRAMLTQLLETEKIRPLSGGDSDEEDGGSSSQRRPTHRLPLPSMTVLCSWYQESEEERDNQTIIKKRKLTPQTRVVSRPPVVVIIEDFEGFGPQILQDLIASLSPHLPTFPVVLVLGVATSMTAIHRTLPRSTSSLLSIEQLHTQHSTLTLSHIIEEVLLTSSLPFKLGPRALSFLLHHFYHSTFSVTSFTKALHCAIMEHFCWQPLSVLCGPWSREGGEEKEGVGHMDHTHCEMARATPSLQKYAESLNPDQQLSLLEDDRNLKATMRQLLLSLECYHQRFFPLLRCLFHLTRTLPNAPLGRKLHELYSLSLERTVTEDEKFQTAWSLLRILGRSELSSAVFRCISELEEGLCVHRVDTLQQTLSVLKQFVQDLKELDQKPTEASGGGEGTALPAAREETTSERKMRFQERLRQVASRKKEPGAYEKVSSKMLDTLLETFRVHLRCPCTLPLHEIFYFDNASSLRKHLAAAPRAAIQMALNCPKYYLPSAGSVGERTSLDANMPDICIIYQLHLECGRLINLYDWLQAFVAVVQPGGVIEKGSKKSKQEIGPVLHARFIQAVSELQFLGFIKPTQRKTDHVQRLTWGAC